LSQPSQTRANGLPLSTLLSSWVGDYDAIIDKLIGGKGSSAKGARTMKPTIAQILSEFLAEQERRLSDKTWSRYGQVVELLKTSLNNYGYQGLCPADAERFGRLYNAQGEEHREFCEIFGAEQILPNLREFLGYFMVRKVVAGSELMRAAGTVTKALSKWLAKKGYVGAAEGRDGAEQGAAASHDLPQAQALARNLSEYAERQATVDDGEEEAEEDQFRIAVVENGRIWLERMDGHRLGPLALPPTLARRCKVGWSISGVVGQVRGKWRLLEVWNVYPE
jgi:hypothetical protein